MSDERVLVIPEAKLHEVGGFSGFRPFCERAFATLLDKSVMEFRPRCEVEEDPSYKQLIPYAILQTEVDGELSVFQYTRGSGQGEKRLHAKRSIGIGGHISLEDADGEDLYRSGMQRELHEELVFDGDFEEELVGFIYDDSNAVGRVHLGVVHRLIVPDARAHAREDQLLEGGFRSVAQLKQQREGFETWSQLCLDNLYQP